MKNKLLNAIAIALILFNAMAPIGALAYTSTDQEDYAPGSVVTIFGDNSDGAGYLPGETVHVDVDGPNGYTAACDAVADDHGAWSCQVTLWDSTMAVGSYSFAATGTISGVVQNGTFTDAITFDSFESTCSTVTNSFVSGTTVCSKATGLGSNPSGKIEWWAPGAVSATRIANFSPANGNISDTFAPSICGSWTLKLYIPATASSTTATDTFTVTSCAVATTTAASNASATYGDTAVTLSATVSPNPGGGSVSFFVDGSPAGSASVGAGGVATVSYDPSSLNVGPYTIRADFGGLGTFLASSSDPNANGTLTIAATNADCNITGFTGDYDGAAHGASGTCDDINGNPLSGLDLGASFTNVPGGTANWIFTSPSANYNNDSGSVLIVINAVDPACDVVGFSGNYDGNAHGATNNGCTGVNDEPLTGSFTSTDFANVPGGTANWSFNPDSGNYNTVSGTASIVINAVDPTCDVVGFSGDYDGNAHGATNNGCTGVNNESLTGSFTSTDFANVPGGTANWSFDPDSGNYNTKSGTASIVINAVDPTCDVVGFSGDYDGNAHGATNNGCTGVNNESLTGTFDPGDSFTNVPGGTANWSFDPDSGNYNTVGGSVEIVINAVDPTCDVVGFSGDYDGNAHGATSNGCTGVNNESLTGTFSSDSFTDVPGGTANWSFDPDSGNYNTKSGTANIVINAVDPACDVVGFSGDYDGNAHGATSNGCTGVNNESLTGTFSSDSFTNVPGGTANWSFDPDSGNYNTVGGTASIVINAVDPACDVVGFSGDYDGNAHGATSNGCTGVNNESLTGTFSSDSFTDVPGGTANWSFDPDSGNYNTVGGTASIVINKAPSTTTVACPASVTYTGSAVTPCSATVTGAGGLNQSVPVSYTNNINPGANTATASASYPGDVNHLNSSDSKTFSILYATAGMCYGGPGHSILQPINADGTSVSKQGSTVPAKFRVCDAYGNSIGTPGVVQSFRLVQVISGLVSTPVDEPVVSTTPDTAFRWSASDQQWIFNINTKNLQKNKTYVYLITLNDGSTIEFQFGLK